jgi:hypothetical protein
MKVLEREQAEIESTTDNWHISKLHPCTAITIKDKIGYELGTPFILRYFLYNKRSSKKGLSYCNTWVFSSKHLDSKLSQLEIDKKNYLEQKEKYIDKYEGKYIALINGKVEDSDTRFSEVAKRIYHKFGYKEIFITFVSSKPQRSHRISPKFI